MADSRERSGSNGQANAGEDPAAPTAIEDIPPEALLVVLRGIGASMLLTDQHLIIARDGADWRPRTGVQAYGFDAIRHMRIELGRAPSGRIAVWTTGAQEVLSMFFDARSLERAQELVDAARPLIARSRSEDPATEPAARSEGSPEPPSGPRDTRRRRSGR